MALPGASCCPTDVTTDDTVKPVTTKPVAAAAAAADICQARLPCGAACRWKGRHEVDGERLCGVHARSRRAEVECPVCLVAISRRGLAEMACGHRFHTKCLRAWFRRRPLSCPMCRGACLEGLALLGPRLAPKLQALIRTLPPPPRAFFPAYIVAHLQSPHVAAALGADPDMVGLLVDLACECFTRDNFFAKLRALGL